MEKQNWVFARVSRPASDAAPMPLTLLREILPYVKDSASADVKSAFEKALSALASPILQRRSRRSLLLRNRRAAAPVRRGRSVTGLKPAGLDVGPVIPVAEKAIVAHPMR
jgi:hypothetical protein